MTRAHVHLAPRSLRALALPPSIAPMLAVAGDLPHDPRNWGFEYKWDGVRCMAFWDGRQVKLLSRNAITITQRYPELADLGAAIAKRGVILDGEIVALNQSGQPSFARLQERMHVDDPSRALVRRIPVWYVLFDILYFGGKSIMELPYAARRASLENVVAPDEHWQVTPYHIGEGKAMLETARHGGMEGVVAKLLTSPYLPGRRSPLWRKIKVVQSQEFVIGGWIAESTGRPDRVGALLLGYYERAPSGDRVLRYAGRVGSGFSDATHARLASILSDLKTDAHPFAEPVPRAGAIFIKPSLVAEVEFRRWPQGGLVQQAAFKGLRDDKSALDVVRESKGQS